MNENNDQKSKYINDDVYSFKLRAYSPLPLRIITIVMGIGLTVQFLSSLYWPLLIFIFLCIVFFFAQMRIEIDLYRRLYRIGMNIFGKQFGKWLNTDQVDYLNIFPTKTSQTIGSYYQPNSAAITNSQIHVNFIFKNRKREQIFFTENVKEAKVLAHNVATSLQVGLYDCTGEENVWVIEK